MQSLILILMLILATCQGIPTGIGQHDSDENPAAQPDVLPIDIASNFFNQFLPPKSKAALVRTNGHFFEAYPPEIIHDFANHYGIKTIEWLKTFLKRKFIDEQFVRLAIQAAPRDLLSAIIRNSALLSAPHEIAREFEIVEFAIEFGADPSPLNYVIKQLAVHNQEGSIENLRRKIGHRHIIDFEAIINTKLNVTRLRQLVSICKVPIKESIEVIHPMMYESIDAGTLDRLLQISARFNCLDLAEFLLENGADVDVKPERRYNIDDKDTGSRRPISWASSKGYEPIVRLLLAYGADPSSALDEAVEKGHIGTVRLLLDFGADLDPHGTKPLSLAVEKGRADVARVLLEHGANVHNIRDDILLMPVIEGRLDVVYVLLEHGATVHPSYVGRAESPLANAGRAEDYLAIANLLKLHGLMQSIKRGNLAGVGKFIELGAQVQPWMVKLAKEKGQMQIVSELKQHGLRQVADDPQAILEFIKIGAQVQPWMVKLAKEKGQMQIASELKQHGLRQVADDPQAILEFIKIGAQVQPWMVKLAEEKDQTQIARELKQHGLRQAVEKGDLDEVNWYLEKGAKADQEMIEYAKRKGYHEITKLLTPKSLIKLLMSWRGKKKTL